MRCAVGVGTIVFSSSCATFGVATGPANSGRSSPAADQPYGESKLFIERVLHWYGEAYGLRWMALRYFNAAGADPDGDLGECRPETHLIPSVIEAALGRRQAFDLYGTTYPTHQTERLFAILSTSLTWRMRITRSST